jgi:hypothetical protein
MSHMLLHHLLELQMHLHPHLLHHMLTTEGQQLQQALRLLQQLSCSESFLSPC